MKKLIVYLSLLILGIVFTSTTAITNTNAEEAINNCQFDCNAKCGMYLHTDNDYAVVEHGNVCTLSYTIDNSVEVSNVDLNYQSENDTVNISFNLLDNNNFTVNFSVCALGEIKAKIICTVTLNNGQTICLSDNVYIYAREDFDFLSRDSMLDAKFYCYMYMTNTTEPTFDGYDVFYSNQAADNINDINMSDINIDTQNQVNTTYVGDIEICGMITWVDEDGNTHNAENVTVAIQAVNWAGAFVTIAETTTIHNGFYSITVSKEYIVEKNYDDFRLKVSTEGGGIKLTTDTWAVYNVYQEGIVIDLSQNSKVLSFCIDPDNYESEDDKTRAFAFSVHQAMNLGVKYMKTKCSDDLPVIKVRFPKGNGTYYNGIIDNHPVISVYIDDWSDWDVILHEYGHFVADYYDIDDSPGGDHNINDCLNAIRGKDKGMPLAWSEGWATYFSIASQLEMEAMYLNIDNVGDTSYSDTIDESIDIDLETPVDDAINWGESSEIAVAAVLLDLADGISEDEEDIDNIALGYDYIWDLIAENNCTDFSSFINVLYENITVSQCMLVGEILSAYNVAPNSLLPGIDYTAGWTPPTFTWDPQGGENGEDGNYANNLFTVVFYNNDKELIYVMENLTGNTYTPSSNIWYEILSNSEDELYWSVKAYQTTTYETGPYYSTFRKINIPDVVELNTTTNVNDSVGVNEVIWYKFTAPALSKYAFFTTGNCDTYGELFPAMVPDNTFTNKYSGDDDSGDGYNFRIVYNLTPGQVVYLRVSRLFDSETDDFTLCVQHVHEYVYRSVNARFHILKCNCGATSGSNEAHVINGSYSPPDGNTRYKPCIGCGEMIDTWAGGVFPIIKNNVIAYVTYQNRLIGDELLDLTITETNMSAMVINGAKYSANGSYMLPDGTAVLVEEDVDAYFAGTLVFYDQDEIPLKE